MSPVQTAYDFEAKLQKQALDLAPVSIETLQLNLTKLCNQACHHCHVDASPKRTEQMSDQVLDKCLEILADHSEIKTLDLTGGAPELHPRFKEAVKRASVLNKKVMVRHNLTVTLDPHPQSGESMQDLPEFFANQSVEVISSLPYYQPFFTDRQRGQGVFAKSIESLRRLNAVGYGQAGSGLVLNLVYNPVGAFLPASQANLEADYKRTLAKDYGIVFNQLFTITNMPIHRFKTTLERLEIYEEYLDKLVGSFNPTAAQGVMCRFLLSVGYDGQVYDCDFNQMLEWPIAVSRPSILDFDFAAWLQRQIVFGSHCFGCTAGAGSSCTGTTT